MLTSSTMVEDQTDPLIPLILMQCIDVLLLEVKGKRISIGSFSMAQLSRMMNLMNSLIISEYGQESSKEGTSEGRHHSSTDVSMIFIHLSLIMMGT